jgi:hypothetical protein
MAAIASSPLLPARHVLELSNFYYEPPSRAAFNAALAVAEQTEPLEMPNLTMIETVDGLYHRTFTAHPTLEEWQRLERGGIVPFDDGDLFIHMDVIH